MEKINRRLYLRITNRCNRNCGFCYYANEPKIAHDISLDDVKKAIAKELEVHPEDKYLRIEVTGGEPSLVANIDEILEYLTGLPKVYITLETNGTNLMTDSFLKTALKFKEPNSHFLKISLNTELIDSDPNWIQNVVDFQQFAKENNIRYVFNARVKDAEDRARLEQIVKENNIHPSYKDIIYYPIHNINLFKDGYLPYFGKHAIIYDVDGSELVEIKAK